MQLNDILEENSIKAISQKTNIPDDNLEYLFANKFEKLPKVKTFGFISILEREYAGDLQVLRTAAKAYYDVQNEDQRITLNVVPTAEKKGKSKFLFLVVLILLGYATWYFLTQFDQKHFSDLLEFIDSDDTEIVLKPENVVKDLSIAATATSAINVEKNTTDEHKSMSDSQVEDKSQKETTPQNDQ